MLFRRPVRSTPMENCRSRDQREHARGFARVEVAPYKEDAQRLRALETVDAGACRAGTVALGPLAGRDGTSSARSWRPRHLGDDDRHSRAAVNDLDISASRERDCAKHAVRTMAPMFARFWLHNGFPERRCITKRCPNQLGNIVLVHDLLEKAPGERPFGSRLLNARTTDSRWTGRRTILTEANRKLDQACTAHCCDAASAGSRNDESRRRQTARCGFCRGARRRS